MKRQQTIGPDGGPVPADPGEVLLLRTCSDTTLTATVRGLRARFPRARIVLLSSSLQPIVQCDVDDHHVHAGGKRALAAWLRGRRWSIVAVPHGEDVLWRWRVTLPSIASASQRIAVWPDGALSALDPGVWAREVWRGAQDRWLLGLLFLVSRGLDVLTGLLAVTGMLVRVPVRIGAAFRRKPGTGITSTLR
jgi:hypothetical protein